MAFVWFAGDMKSGAYDECQKSQSQNVWSRSLSRYRVCSTNMQSTTLVVVVAVATSS